MAAAKTQGARLMAEQYRNAWQTLEGKVTAVAALHRRCQLAEGAGRYIWMIGVPLLAAVGLEILLRLPLALRAPVVPFFILACAVLGWRYIVRPVRERYSLKRSAMLVEDKRPELKSRVISALELYPELARERSPFDRSLLEGLMRHAAETTEGDDFLDVVDRSPAKQQALAAFATTAIWIVLIASDPSGVLSAFARFGSAWSEMSDIARKMAGARITIADLERPAFLKGSDIQLSIAQEGFLNSSMDVYVRNEGETDWRRQPLVVDSKGKAEFTVEGAQKTFECYSSAGRIESERKTVIVTERPRIVRMSVEYDLPEYVRRASMVQPRSDGNLKALFGSSILLTIEANKPLASVSFEAGFLDGPESFSVGGQFAQGAIRVDSPKWLKNRRQSIRETYRLALKDEYGYANEDAGRRYNLEITKDVAPSIHFVGLPHRSSASEPHILERNLDGINLAIRGRDDYGITRVVLHYRIEDLDTGREKSQGSKPIVLGVPRVEIPRMGLSRLSQFNLEVGDRFVFRAEAEDAYDLEPESGPHKARTPTFRLAIVTEEQMFADVVYRDDWSANWYDSLKVASLASRRPPPRLAPESEPTAKIAEKLLQALPVTESFQGEASEVIQSYFESLSGGE